MSFLSDGVHSEKEHGEAFDEHTQTTTVICFAAFVIIMCIEEDFTGRSIDFELHRKICSRGILILTLCSFSSTRIYLKGLNELNFS